VDRFGEKEMSRGVILFAFNSPEYNYVKMANYTAKRVKHFLDLPVTLIVDHNSIDSVSPDTFDRIITVDSDSNNNFQGRVWLNKGRYQAYDLSPYEETLLLDVDYVINSNKLLKIFDFMDDFCCHNTITYLMDNDGHTEKFNPNNLSIVTLWATVVAFKKTKRVKQIFECLKMVQENYEHYSNIHKFSIDTYRNDYGLTIALKIVNGHSDIKTDIIPWNLIHILPETNIYKSKDEPFNTEYTILYTKWRRGKSKKEYITLKDMDFHVIDKNIFLELINE
jgi:hypothetical protein